MSADPASRSQEIASILNAGAPGSPRGRMRKIVAAVLAIVLALLAYAYFSSRSSQPANRYATQALTRGKLVVTVSATGNLQPTNKVDVGSELSGTIDTVFVDDNDRIRKGQALARLDMSKLQDQVSKSSLVLVAAQAQAAQMQATVEEARANLERLRQVAVLSGGKVPSKAELQNGEAALKRAIANEASARASIGQARASLKSDRTNLSKATIRSPIDGVVLVRKVEPGQTVAATLQAPVLFTLAENLKQMKLEVDVDEADVGQVRDGQRATFRVDAYPNRAYPSHITRTGFGSQVKEGVVSYLTVLAVDNDDLSLRPGMTATAEIITATRENALLVPNAALRFTPPQRETEQTQGGGLVSKLVPRPPRPARRRASATPGKGGTQQIWIVRDGEPEPVSVTTGASDGRMTELLQGAVRPGMQVITESLSSAK